MQTQSQQVVSSIPYAGVPRTIATMRSMLKGAIDKEHDMALRALVEDITAQVQAKDYVSEAAAIYYWVLVNPRYIRDPLHIELVKNPLVVLQKRPSDMAAGRRAGQADCDEIATLMAAMMMQAGNPCSFITLSMTQDPGFHHVLTKVKIQGPTGPLNLICDPVPGPSTQSMLERTVHWAEWPIEPVRRTNLGSWDVPSKPALAGTGRPPLAGVWL